MLVHIQPVFHVVIVPQKVFIILQMLMFCFWSVTLIVLTINTQMT